MPLSVFRLAPITTLLSLTGIHCHSPSAFHGDVISNWATGGSHMEPRLGVGGWGVGGVCDNWSNLRSLKDAFTTSVVCALS